MDSRPLIAGIDAGGTTFKLGIAAAGGPVLDKLRVETTVPRETIAKSVGALRRLAAAAGGHIEAIGIASFGPVDVDPGSPGYGTILTTPKPGWSGTPLLSELTAALGVPGALDTDVNAALEAEMAGGAAQGLTRAAYVTVGTGIGVGVKTDGRFAGRPFHPELGHIRVERHPADTGFKGLCPFHGGCLEGLCAAPALIARYGRLEGVRRDHDAWDVAGFYLAQLCMTLSLSHRLERVVLGGGVLSAPALIGEVRRHFGALMAGYLENHPPPEAFAAPAALGTDAGLIGSLLLGRRALGA